MERVRFCRQCGEAFGWGEPACPACGHAVGSVTARAAPRRSDRLPAWLTDRKTRMVLLFVGVLAALYLLSMVPSWFFD